MHCTAVYHQYSGVECRVYSRLRDGESLLYIDTPHPTLVESRVSIYTKAQIQTTVF